MFLSDFPQKIHEVPPQKPGILHVVTSVEDDKLYYLISQKIRSASYFGPPTTDRNRINTH